jgi:RING finger protein 121
MHSKMFVIFFAATILAQFGLVMWKRYHARSFHVVSLVGLWLVPAGLSFAKMAIRFLSVWLLFSVANGLVVWRASESPLKRTTPR